jgi:hypothetical protein
MVTLDTLNLPAYEFQQRERAGKREIYDPIRQKYVRLTPEEWVRQHFVQYLIRDRGVPRGLVTVEQSFDYQGMARRADIIVHDRAGQPLLMTECKAPAVPLEQATLDQVARYNRVVDAPFLIITNGLEHYCCRIDRAAESYEFLDAVPAYDAMQ